MQPTSPHNAAMLSSSSPVLAYFGLQNPSFQLHKCRDKDNTLSVSRPHLVSLLLHQKKLAISSTRMQTPHTGLNTVPQVHVHDSCEYPLICREGLCKCGQVKRRSCCVRVSPKSSTIKQMTTENVLYKQGPLSEACGHLNRKEIQRRGRCIHRADPPCCTAETNIRLESNDKLQEKLTKNDTK